VRYYHGHFDFRIFFNDPYYGHSDWHDFYTSYKPHRTTCHKSAPRGRNTNRNWN